jgi:hypothetical protein
METLLIMLLGIILLVFWCFQFVFLMLLEDELFAGKYDKAIWASVFIILSPIAPFVFWLWQKAARSEKEARISADSITQK